MLIWDTATWFALIALIVSVLSCVAAAWSAVIAQGALAHTRTSSEQERRESFERQRSDLLEVINTGKGRLNRACTEIGALKAIFDAEPHSVKAFLINYTSLFSVYLPMIENGVRQSAALWDEIAWWDHSKGTSALMQHEARFRALLNEDQMALEQGMYMVGVFEGKLEQARKHMAGTVR